MPTVLITVIFAAIAFASGWLYEYLSFSGHRNDIYSAKYEIYDQQLPLSDLDEAEAYRKTASIHAENRSRLIISSTKLFSKNDKKGAKEFSDEAKQEGILMDESNQQAAKYYFKHNNCMGVSNSNGEVDLHGLYVDEALIKARESIQLKLKEPKGSRHIVFIVGMGNHSVGGLRKIKPALEEMIHTQYGYLCVPDKPHNGCVWVEIDDPNSQKLNKKENSFCIVS